MKFHFDKKKKENAAYETEHSLQFHLDESQYCAFHQKLALTVSAPK